MKMQIRRQPAPSAADVAEGNNGDPFGRLPLPVGQIVTKGMKLTNKEREMLAQAGWREDDPIPENMPSILAAAKQKMDRLDQAIEQEVLPELAQQEQLPPPETVNIDDIEDADTRKMVEQALRFAKEHGKVGPAKSSTTVFGPQTQFKDDRQPRRLPVTPPRPVAQSIEQPLPESPQQPIHNINSPERCVHCGWDPAQPDPTDPTDMDKRGFLQALLGDKRFFKRYVLFNGKIVVVFRTLTSVEAEKCWTKVSQDSKDGKIVTANDIYQKLLEYRLVCGLHSVTSVESGTTDVPELAEFLEGKIELPEIVDRVRAEILTSESIWRTVGVTFATFQRLYEKLEARASDPDFWKAIEQPRS